MERDYNKEQHEHMEQETFKHWRPPKKVSKKSSLLCFKNGHLIEECKLCKKCRKRGNEEQDCRACDYCKADIHPIEKCRKKGRNQRET